MARLIWTEKAVTDLENIYDFIAADSPFYAKVQVQKVIAAAERLILFPESGRPLPELPQLPHHELICGSYRIIFRHDPAAETVSIVTIVHAARFMDEELLK
ncbi:type II toxin-antitoxin system RelE/ParE family toxin [Geomesophilobacter sediminis]|uniref:Type II toxin-antitoxin system RelE/ParE family toxin n=1 Tax=Geomesophilobacter sediminis TaxID=2798584 RepID=A0A8J7LWU6_9BACT|nr:type II toxin-antitoxin system RelE/ParE family toxin [Geomesophilobacter sediminis]MBJ6726265.1 type II toxin-antitoxin system RelE/ParE family toxin [Geomesophilobacter sediminis]